MSNIDREIVKVELGDRAYDIVIGESLLADSLSYIEPLLSSKSIFIITDENVVEAGHLSTLKNSFSGAKLDINEIILPAGESTKSFSVFEDLLNKILAHRPERKTTLIALGGGVIGDITGFAASVLLRGVDFIQIPTTLLSMVDSSVGGKTGINTKYGKNLIGTFYQPKLVLADISTLLTLADREVLAGYAEVVKYGLIDDAEFFAELEAEVTSGSQDIIRSKTAIKKCCEAKARIVAEDEREGGKRALLNLGHTFGHALEAEMGYDGRLLHGEAVSVGMVIAFQFSYKIGLCSKNDVERVKSHLQQVGLPVNISDIKGENFNAETLVNNMKQDKKVSDGKLVFILVNGIGQSFIKKDISVDDVTSFVKEII